MSRLRQKHKDCVVIVFRYITGEDESSALSRFFPYLNGEEGISLDALTSCLREAGYVLTSFADVVPDDRNTFREFWGRFQGEAVMFYTPDSAPVAHAVLVRSGGIVVDPDLSSPEEGEFIDEYFKRVGEKITIKSLSKVTRMSPQEVRRR
jgi:hypothetical protein